jgi:hypothetical protein
VGLFLCARGFFVAETVSKFDVLLYNGFASALVSVTAPTPSPEPPGGERLPATSGGERDAAAPAPRALTRIGFTTVPRKAPPRATRYRVILAHEAIACPGASASAARRPAQAAWPAA